MSGQHQSRGQKLEAVPYGLRVAHDCVHLEENQAEIDVMLSILEGLVRDSHMAEIAADLNRRGFVMRNGMPWSQSEVFDLLPRLIDFGSRLFKRDEWHERRELIMRRYSAGA